MKMVLFTIILSLNYIYISNVGCDYWEKEDKKAVTDANYLSQLHTEEEKKQKCYSLSNFKGVGNSLCCYNKNKGCFKNETDTDPNECPKGSTIYNNCGMAGIYEPVYSTICTEISLVQGYCCFVKTSIGNACIRTKELDENVNATTEQINKYVHSIKSEAEIKSVICNGWNLKLYKMLSVLITLMLV